MVTSVESLGTTEQSPGLLAVHLAASISLTISGWTALLQLSSYIPACSMPHQNCSAFYKRRASLSSSRILLLYAFWIMVSAAICPIWCLHMPLTAHSLIFSNVSPRFLSPLLIL